MTELVEKSHSDLEKIIQKNVLEVLRSQEVKELLIGLMRETLQLPREVEKEPPTFIPNESGFVKNASLKTHCTNTYHNPPTDLNIPTGYSYRHVCPECGQTITIVNQAFNSDAFGINTSIEGS